MIFLRARSSIAGILAIVCFFWLCPLNVAEAVEFPFPFPQTLEFYRQQEQIWSQALGHPLSMWEILKFRIYENPLNLILTLLFFGAIIHTFLAAKFQKISHRINDRYRQKLAEKNDNQPYCNAPVSFWGQIFHFLGEIEVIFGIWLIPVAVAISLRYDWHTFTNYISSRVIYTEPMFVVVIMCMAATRPILKLVETVLGFFSSIGKHGLSAWWFAILIVAPLLGSFITEPAAMTIAALLLGKKFYDYRPSRTFAYATLGLLFVNISVGGVLTHFAAPPVLIVATKWQWNLPFMLITFGWKSILGIGISTAIYGFIFRKELKRLDRIAEEESAKINRETAPKVLRTPFWIYVVHVLFMAFTVYNLHTPPVFWFAFLFFLAFVKATTQYQSALSLREPLLVGFFLAGLVTHGGLQQWWIAPVLGNLSQATLFLGTSVLSMFNDNAAITYLTSLVPEFAANHTLQYIVVVGAISAGGLTVIANAPNPAGQSLLQKYFGENGVSPLALFLAALPPTIIIASGFLLL